MKGIVGALAWLCLCTVVARVWGREAPRLLEVDETPAPPPPPAELIHLIGRFDVRDPAGPRFAWPGSAIVAGFSGTGIDVRLRDTGSNFFTVSVDRGAPTSLATTGGRETYALATNLPPGRHEIVLTKRTESWVGVVQLLGLDPHDGALVPSPYPFARAIEYIGDSITCGYGDLGTEARCHFSARTEDETVAYGALAAAQLGVQQTVIAYSGKRMARWRPTADEMPTLFGRTLPDDPTSTWTFETRPPDVVVINLGTNDFGRGDPGATFAQTYVAFVHELRGHYPTSLVICALGPMLSDGYPHGAMLRTKAARAIEGVVRQLQASGDARVAYLAFDEQQRQDGYGCDYHPSAKTNRRMATKLVERIRSLTGW